MKLKEIKFGNPFKLKAESKDWYVKGKYDRSCKQYNCKHCDDAYTDIPMSGNITVIGDIKFAVNVHQQSVTTY